MTALNLVDTACAVYWKNNVEKLQKDLQHVVNGVSVAILTVLKDDGVPNVVDAAIVLEGAIILQDIPDMCTAFAYLFGLL